MYYKQEVLINEIVQLSHEEKYQDVTIIGQNGKLKTNSFLLASIFPIFRTILNSTAGIEDHTVISMPDMNVIPIKTFLQNIGEPIVKISIGQDVLLLLQSTPLNTDINIKHEAIEVIETVESKDDLFKEDIFNLLDPEVEDEVDVNSPIKKDAKPLVLGIMNFDKKDLIKKKHDRKTKAQMDCIKRFYCADCDKEFATNKKLLDHKYNHILKKCLHCHKMFNGTNLGKHLKRCKAKKRQITTEEDTIPVSQKLGEGVKKMRKCPECGNIVYKLSNLVLHLKNEHNITTLAKKKHIHGTVTYKCKKCDFVATEGKDVRNHFNQSHKEQEEIPCHVCGKIFRSQKRLETHLQTHVSSTIDLINARLRKNIKNRGYLNEANFKDLVEVVDDVAAPVFKCRLCDNYSTEVFGSMQRHFNNKHSGAGGEEIKVPCHVCGKNFYRTQIGQHMNRMHLAKEGHIKCQKCRKDVLAENFPSHECETFSESMNN